LIGVVMMIIGGTNVRFANGISSLLYALMVPISFIGITLVYRRLKHETIIEPFMLTKERDARKAAESEALRDEAAQQIAKA
jgi:predicted tellurium resistance membrane protein TerC